jgi:pimeloyl-ACP methyl ester carboxylesterase
MKEAIARGYAPVNGLEMYYEIWGEGEPLVLLHGGLGTAGMFGPLLPLLAAQQRVVAIDLQAHGRTADIDRPMRWKQLADDVAELTRLLDLGPVRLMGYSMGGSVALRTAIEHPDLVQKLVLVSTAHRHDAWYPEIATNMRQMAAPAAPYLKDSPMYQAYVQVAPRPEEFPRLLDRMGELVRQPYDWSDEVAALQMPVMLVYADHDSVPLSNVTEFFELLGGGKEDANWDRSKMTAHRVAVLPGATHYDVFANPALAAAVTPFLTEEQAVPQLV